MSRVLAAFLFLAVLAASSPAEASFLSGDALDAFANGLSWVVLLLVPIGAVALFWYVHILPEVIAEKRHHPQKDSIKTLCILSLFFGGLLWPFAWLWAYTRPVGFRVAYGTEKHEDYFIEMGEEARAGKLSPEEMIHLRSELAAMATRGNLPPMLAKLRSDLDVLIAQAPAKAAEAARTEVVAGGND
jgi:CBS domain containing-hemolysin-like protein